ncbi:acetylornithine deacetylase [Litorimonas cladophorae]|uniref:Acetylornithine deacetylase n=1 Tax=Litorimonas cladophorae TaxID=1220491 RepID=A0A918NGA0_9PROT|nr:hydrolase [Litorimonas cladophorae]GGX68359.1 acetylornithine deacetylase [Litorimonas cladophorae]
MNVDHIPLGKLTETDQVALDKIAARQDDMLARTIGWSKINTGSWNAAGLNDFSKVLAEVFGETEAVVELVPTAPIEKVDAKGNMQGFQSGPVLRATARPDAPNQIVMTGHYDTVFPKGTFTEVTDLGDGRFNGPGLTDMKGGICVMLEALKAFESGPLKDQLGYCVVLSPDEETGNHASNDMIMEAARKAHLGLTFEPCMEDGSFSGARKGSAVWDVIFQGKSAHAGREPEKGRSALMAASDFALRIEALTDAREGTTFNIGSIDGGDAVNVVPALCVVRLGARAPDAPSADWAQAQVDAALAEVLKRDGITAHTHGGFYRPPKPRNAAQNKLFGDVAETAEALGITIQFKDTGGVCEGNNVFAAGTPNIDTLGVRGGRIHSSEEFLVADSLSERAGLATLILHRIAEGRIDAKAIKALMGK